MRYSIGVVDDFNLLVRRPYKMQAGIGEHDGFCNYDVMIEALKWYLTGSLIVNGLRLYWPNVLNFKEGTWNYKKISTQQYPSATPVSKVRLTTQTCIISEVCVAGNHKKWGLRLRTVNVKPIFALLIYAYSRNKTADCKYFEAVVSWSIESLQLFADTLL